MAARALSSTTRPSVVTLDDPGNPDAEPGSRPWAISVRLALQSRIHQAEFDRGSVGQMAHLMQKYAGYRQLYDAGGRPFASYRAFCQERPPWGLGYDPEVLQHLIDGPATTVEERAQLQLPLALQGRPQEIDKGNNVTFTPTKRGNDPAYLTGRIARDRPDVLEGMKAGKYPSVRAAARDAGIVTPTLTIPRDPVGAARVIRRHFTPEQLAALIAALGE